MFIKYYQKVTGIDEISDITKNNVKEFLMQGRIKKNWKASSFITAHKSLFVFFQWCVKNNYLENNVLEDIELPKLNKSIPPKLTQQEAMKLLEVTYNLPYKYQYLRYRNHALLATFIFTGLRKAEVLNLKYTDVDLENRTVFVNHGKGGKDRIIPINFTLIEILGRYLKERKRLKKTCPEFFTSLNRNQGFTSSGLKRALTRIKKESGINFGTHKLRHTFATLMLEGGCDIYSLSKMMGHSDIKTTTIYLSASAEHLRQEMTKHPLNNIM